MKATSSSWVVLVAASSMLSCTGVAGASELYGLLRSRDLSPFGFLRLDMRPAYAVSIKPGSWAIETELGYQNTWALSPEVEKYLVALEPLGRRDLGPADVQAIRDLPGESYLVDTELALADVTFHYKFSSNWTGYVMASAASYQGGFLDSTIEEFHNWFGFSSFGRPAVKRNEVNLIFDLKSSQMEFLGSPTDGGLTDPTLGLRYVGIRMPEDWRLAVEAAAKIPLAGRHTLLSTGRTDYGLQASLQRLGRHQGFYVSAAAVYYAGARGPVPQDSQVIPTLVLGYERILTDRTNVNVQGYASTSVYSHDQTDIDELLKEKYQLSLGVRHRLEHLLISFAFTENLQNVNNTPDIGFQFGVAYLP